MSDTEINKKGIDGLSTISKALLDGVTGQAILRVNNGGLRNKEGKLCNKDVRGWANELFKTDVIPYLNKRGDSPTIITGKIVCNLSDGVVNSIQFKDWYLSLNR